MIEQYLSNRLGQGTYIVGEGEVKQLRLSAAAGTSSERISENYHLVVML